ncbi:hypothetical protein CRE_15798 [Caenorhabditis remanei]|uniref:Uncharacterized protein n=1 Tax=Caenorhabditis remanei TaxID=31234 RepID=E3NMG0_CAERE|nr:hypothetical protein CRE_15798 [Caenorhabditis remanei]
MVSDSGSELVLTEQLQQLDRVHCGCHLLNLIISDFSKEKKVNYIYCRVQAFARHLAKHKIIRDKLRSRCTDLLRQKKRNRATVNTIDDLLSVAELIKIERAKNEAEAFFEEDEEEFQPDEENEEDSEKADLDDWMDDDELQGFGTEEL